MSSTLPKLSYVLLSHNREKYIRAAIESAFAQDYEGELEYIFSDDCSTDRTFEIINECVAEYKGNRRVVVTQTPRNLHLAGNTNHAVQFVESDWVIRADDDDISHVSRCSMIGEAIAQYPSASSVFARFRVFYDREEEEIRVLSQNLKREHPTSRILSINDTETIISLFNLPDCLHQAWSVNCYRNAIFGKLPVDGYYVDDVITNFRALALGDCIEIDAECAYIRRQSGNMSCAGDKGQKNYASIIALEKFNDKYHNNIHAPLQETRAALATYIENTNIEGSKILECIDSLIRDNEILKDYWKRGTLYRIRVNRHFGRKGVFAWMRCLPMPIFAFMLFLYRLMTNKV